MGVASPLRHSDDVPDVLRAIARGIRIRLISNSHRPLTSFQSHFELDGLMMARPSRRLITAI